MRKRLTRAGAGLGAASVVWAMTFVAAPAAGASTALCGTTITTSLTLTEDVGPCPNNGIIIGANNITLNLAGHRIFGTDQVFDGAGVLANNRTGVTIRGGTVQYFDAGVVLFRGGSNTVTNMFAYDNIGRLTTAESSDFGEGILIFGSNNNRILSNVAERNGPFGGIDLLGNADNNLVQGNTIANNTVAATGAPHPGVSDTVFNDGIRLEHLSAASAPNFNTIQYNTIRGNGLDGIAVFFQANDNRIINNVIERNGFQGNARRGDGIHLFANVFRTYISGNRVTENARNGIRIDPTPTNPPPALNNVITRNVVVNNGLAPLSDPAFDLSDGNPNCDNNSWTQNQHYTEDFTGPIDCLN